MSEERRIKMPFVFMNPFDRAEDYVVVVWINKFRTRQHKPVMVDWTAKALLEFATTEQIKNLFKNNLALWSPLRAVGKGPEWLVKISDPAPASITSLEAVEEGFKPLRRLRGVFRSKNRIIPGWALDAFPDHIVNTFINSYRYGASRPFLFCLPDSSDKVFVEIVCALQRKLAYHAGIRADIECNQEEKAQFVFCVNPKLRHKKKLIESLGEKSHRIFTRRNKYLFYVEPEFKEAS